MRASWDRRAAIHRTGSTQGVQYWLHLTYADGHRIEVAAVDPIDLVRGTESFQRALWKQFCVKAFRVEPEEMADLGMTLWLPKPSLRDLFERFGTRRRRRYKLPPNFMAPLSDHMEGASPLVLRQPWAKELDQVLFATFSDAPGQVSVGRLPDWIDGEGPGWIAAPVPFVTDDLLRSLLVEQFPCLLPTFYWVARELQADVDRDAIRGDRALRKPHD